MAVALQPWAEGDLPLLKKLLGDPSMRLHLGGPETEELVRKRHQRHLDPSETDHMFKIVQGPAAEAVGSTGYWEVDPGPRRPICSALVPHSFF